MKTVRELVQGNIKDYENLIRILYEVAELTGVDMEQAIARLDDIYDGKRQRKRNMGDNMEKLNCKELKKEG